MKKSKLLLSLVCALTVITAGLAGCGSKETANTGSDSYVQESEALTENTKSEETASQEVSTDVAVSEETTSEDTIPEKALHQSANGIDTYDNGYMRPELTSLEIVKLMGNGTNLGNTMEACNTNEGNITDDTSYYETMWGQPVTTQEMLDGMKAAGFDTIRIPVAWMTNGTDLYYSGDYTISDAYLNRVEEIINYALNADMYVIINDHWDGGWLGMFGSSDPETRELAMTMYTSMWTQIAERYKEYSDYLIFEGANEELGNSLNDRRFCSDSGSLSQDELYEVANQINQAFVDTVRATGGNNAERFLLIPGINTNIANTCDDRFVMPTDEADRLLISVHFYDPWSYCGDGTSTVKWGTKSDLETMYETLTKMTKFTEMGYGVVIGEYGVLQNEDGSLRENITTYHTFFLDLCDIYGYTACLWDCSGFYKRSQLKMGNDDFAAVYANRNYAAESALSEEDIKANAIASLNTLYNEAPDTFREDAIVVDPDSSIAWIMWNGGGLTYSVGDTYNPDDMSAGIVPTDVLVTGEGTYTVSLDFTGTANGISNSLTFSALAVANGEALYPGYCITIQEVLLNGEPYKLTARPYTTTDDGLCTRVNLYNAWVADIPEEARNAKGGLAYVSPCIIDPAAPEIGNLETISITFYYGPGADS